MRLELATTAVFLIAFAFAVAGVGSGVMSLSVATGFLATVMGFWGLYATWIYAVKVKKLASVFEDLESVVYAFCSILCLLGGVSALILSVAPGMGAIIAAAVIAVVGVFLLVISIKIG